MHLTTRRDEELERLRQELTGMDMVQIESRLEQLSPEINPADSRAWDIFVKEYERRGIPFPA